MKSYPGKTGQLYVVPLYKMVVAGKDRHTKESLQIEFNCIRFGVQYDQEKKVGPRVVGLAESQSHFLTWHKSPSLGWVWQIYGNFLVHEGAKNPRKEAWGALGCIEITGPGKWNEFLGLLVYLGTGVADFKDWSKFHRLSKKVSDRKQVLLRIEGVKQRPALKVKQP
jgi:hypothetical protein